ncbi:hypothetical protein F5X96DRAFT_648039 [Biscogniauxia mediterranea]|nr:hypothetical protein F5X96DRAFT_648039 [Biscogniauxia mediterranea]
MTRSHKYNEKVHDPAVVKGLVPPPEILPKFFAKHGFEGADPNKTKKNGAGKANWGNAGEEVVDENFSFTNARRRSNSSGYTNYLDFKTKFEFNEPEPVFEENVHGPETDEDELAKADVTSSSGSSVDEKENK